MNVQVGNGLPGGCCDVDSDVESVNRTPLADQPAAALDRAKDRDVLILGGLKPICDVTGRDDQ
jgi:hypothetical protein